MQPKKQPKKQRTRNTVSGANTNRTSHTRSHSLVEAGLLRANSGTRAAEGLRPRVLVQGLLKPKLNFRPLHLHGKRRGGSNLNMFSTPGSNPSCARAAAHQGQPLTTEPTADSVLKQRGGPTPGRPALLHPDRDLFTRGVIRAGARL